MAKKVEKTSLALVLHGLTGKPTEVWHRLAQSVRWHIPSAKELVGCGSHGCVYISRDNPSDPALKITNDASEVKFALYQMKSAAGKKSGGLFLGETAYQKVFALKGVTNHGKQVFALFRTAIKHGNLNHLKRSMPTDRWEAAMMVLDEIVEWSKIEANEAVAQKWGTLELPSELHEIIREMRISDITPRGVVDAQGIILDNETAAEKTAPKGAVGFWHLYLSRIPGFEALAASLIWHHDRGVMFYDLGDHNIGSDRIQVGRYDAKSEQAIMFDPGGVVFLGKQDYMVELL